MRAATVRPPYAFMAWCLITHKGNFTVLAEIKFQVEAVVNTRSMY
jgi:hypothetical protein